MTPTEKLINLSKEFGQKEISKIVLENPKFPIWSGAGKEFQHHYGKGGLAQHTLEVVELCLANNSYFTNEKKTEPSKVFLAALFHDSGKMWDYTPKDSEYKEWQGNWHKRHIHHISRSAMIWQDASYGKFQEETRDEITHAILAHHGQREWGSPVMPATRINGRKYKITQNYLYSPQGPRKKNHSPSFDFP